MNKSNILKYGFPAVTILFGFFIAMAVEGNMGLFSDVYDSMFRAEKPAQKNETYDWLKEEDPNKNDQRADRRTEPPGGSAPANSEKQPQKEGEKKSLNEEEDEWTEEERKAQRKKWKKNILEYREKIRKEKGPSYVQEQILSVPRYSRRSVDRLKKMAEGMAKEYGFDKGEVLTPEFEERLETFVKRQRKTSEHYLHDLSRMFEANPEIALKSYALRGGHLSETQKKALQESDMVEGAKEKWVHDPLREAMSVSKKRKENKKRFKKVVENIYSSLESMGNMSSDQKRKMSGAAKEEIAEKAIKLLDRIHESFPELFSNKKKNRSNYRKYFVEGLIRNPSTPYRIKAEVVRFRETVERVLDVKFSRILPAAMNSKQPLKLRHISARFVRSLLDTRRKYRIEQTENEQKYYQHLNRLRADVFTALMRPNSEDGNNAGKTRIDALDIVNPLNDRETDRVVEFLVNRKDLRTLEVSFSKLIDGGNYGVYFPFYRRLIGLLQSNMMSDNPDRRYLGVDQLFALYRNIPRKLESRYNPVIQSAITSAEVHQDSNERTRKLAQALLDNVSQ